MPELPEVETIRRQLAEHVVGRKIKALRIRFAGRLNASAKEFEAALVGRQLKSVDRRAKLLILNFTGGHSLLVHLKMTGAFRLVPSGTAPDKHTHLVFELTGPHDLFFKDLRKFGYLKLVPTKDVPAAVAAIGYGPEPLARDFGAAALADCLKRWPQRKIKQVLLDQTCLAGVGNIYADESLWAAKLRPDRPVATLKAADFARLHAALVALLKQAVTRRGTSADDFFDIFNKPGRNQNYLEAYGRGGEPCSRCGRPITKIKLAGRGTHFCEKCQR